MAVEQRIGSEDEIVEHGGVVGGGWGVVGGGFTAVTS
jgi:hypothetical protein